MGKLWKKALSGLVIVAALYASTACAAAVQRIGCVGDSITAGAITVVGLSPWCQQLGARNTGTKFGVANHGIPGYRCDQIETGVGSGLVYASFARLLTFGYTRLILMCGANDILQGRTADQIYGTLASPGPLLRMIQAALARGIAVTLMTVTPLGGASGYTAGAQTQHADLNGRIRATPGVIVVDEYRALSQTTAIATALATDPGPGAAIAATYQGTPNDNLHPGPVGNTREADAIVATPGAIP